MSLMPIIPGIEDFGTVTFIGSSTEAGDTNPITFSSATFGTGTTNDLLVFTISWNNGSTLSSATVDGNAATIVVQGVGGSNPDQARAAIIQVTAPASSSGDVVLTFTSSSPGTAGVTMGRYRLKRLESHTVSDTDSDANDPFDMSLNVPKNGVVIAAGGWDNSGGTTMTGVDEDYDADRHAGGSRQKIAADATYTVTLDGPSGSGAGVSAVWQ